jgi:hypothetical protein
MTPFRRSLSLVLFVLLGICPLSFAGPAGDLVSASTDGSVVELRTDLGVLVRVTFLDENLLRVQATTGEEPSGRRSYSRQSIPTWAFLPTTTAHTAHSRHRRWN